MQYHYIAENEDDAADFFVLAKENLLDIEAWQKAVAPSETVFQLTDSHWHPLSHHAHKGNYIRISSNGREVTYEVAAIAYDDYPDINTEVLSLAAVANDPNQTEQDTATQPSFIFSITRHSKKVSVAYKPINMDAPDHLPADEVMDHILKAILNFAEQQMG